MNTRYDVFLSHSKADKEIVEDLAHKLSHADLNPFLDAWHLVPGEPWQESVENALDQSQTCAIFLGPDGTKSWENEEMRIALDERTNERNYRVIPVLLPGAKMPNRGDLPRFLSRLTWVDFRAGPDDEDAFYRLTCGIRGIAPGAPAYKPVVQIDPSQGTPVSPKSGSPQSDMIHRTTTKSTRNTMTPSTTQHIITSNTSNKESTLDSTFDTAFNVNTSCAYRGLEAFQEEHADIFFGRESLTQWLVERLSRSRFLGVLGASGSGKSSVVQAGLIPALREGAIQGSEHWKVLVMKPGAHPLEELASQLMHHFDGSLQQGDHSVSGLLQFQDTLASDERALHSAVRIALASEPKATGFLLVLDQFEELFSLCQDEDERQQFIDNLLFATNVAQGLTRVVLTMRADFYSQAAHYAALADRLADHQVMISPMTDPELRDAIAKPAALDGLQLEPGLLETLIGDVQAEPGALPMLQYTLLELWRRREGNWLTFDAYHDIGGIRGAIAHRAEALYERFGLEQKEVTRRIMLRLTQPGKNTEDTRQRVYTRELISDANQAKLVHQVVQQLADARLLIITHRSDDSHANAHQTQPSHAQHSHNGAWNQVVDVAHEALIRGWPRLQRWVRENRAGLIIHHQLTTAANEWMQNQRDDAYLYRGVKLIETESWACRNDTELNPVEWEFLHISRARIEQEEAEREAQRQRELEHAKALAVEQRERADEQAMFATQLRRSAIMLSIISIIATLAATAAILSFRSVQDIRILESQARETAQAEADARAEEVVTRTAAEALAIAREAEAKESAAREAQQRIAAETASREILARQLASQAGFHRTSNPDLALLLAMEAVSTTLNYDGYVTLEAATALRSLLKPSYQQVWQTPDHVPKGGVPTIGDTTEGDTPTKQGLQTGHTSDVHAIAITHDGQRVISASKDKTIRIWDIDTGLLVAVLRGHTATVNALALSPNGRFLASTSANGDTKVRLWDIETARELAVLEGHQKSLEDVSFSHDGRHLVSASRDHTIRIWAIDSQTGTATVENVLEGHSDWVTDVEFSPDSRRIASVSRDRSVRVWDVATGEEVALFTGHLGWVNTVRFSPDGRRIASASMDDTIRIWDISLASQSGQLESGQLESGQLESVQLESRQVQQKPILDKGLDEGGLDTNGTVLVLAGHNRWVNTATFSHDGQYIVSASGDNTVRIWDANTGVPIAVLEGHTDDVSMAMFSEDDRRILSAGRDNLVRVWDSLTHQQIAFLDGHEDVVTDALVMNSDYQVISAGADGTVRMWRIADEPDRRHFNGQNFGVLHVEFDHSGGMLAAAGQDGIVNIWEIDSGSNLLHLPIHRDVAMDATLDGRICMTCPIQLSRFHPASNRLLTLGHDGVAQLWDIHAGLTTESATETATETTEASDKDTDDSSIAYSKPLYTIQAHNGPIFDADFNGAGDLFATSSTEDDIVRLWDANTGKALPLTLQAISGTVQISFSPDDTLLAAAGWDGTLWLWRVDDGTVYQQLKRNDISLESVAFSPDGHYIAAANIQGQGSVWHVETGQLVASLDGHNDRIRSIVYDHSGEYIATAGYDSTVRIWHTTTGETKHILRNHELSVLDVTFSPNGRQLATASKDGTVRLWNVQTGHMEAILPDSRSKGLLVSWQIDEDQHTVTSDNNAIPWITDINYSPTGEWIVAAGMDGSVILYMADANNLQKIASTQVERKLSCREQEEFSFNNLACG
ncbi:MAG: TIR domain-containing protein [Chloroflexota bacterium]